MEEKKQEDRKIYLQSFLLFVSILVFLPLLLSSIFAYVSPDDLMLNIFDFIFTAIFYIIMHTDTFFSFLFLAFGHLTFFQLTTSPG